MCMYILIEVNAHTYISIYVCTVFLKKSKKLGKHKKDSWNRYNGNKRCAISIHRLLGFSALAQVRLMPCKVTFCTDLLT
jgi:hypothetical protein